jgi:hypothetical protein
MVKDKKEPANWQNCVNFRPDGTGCKLKGDFFDRSGKRLLDCRTQVKNCFTPK